MVWKIKNNVQHRSQNSNRKKTESNHEYTECYFVSDGLVNKCGIIRESEKIRKKE